MSEQIAKTIEGSSVLRTEVDEAIDRYLQKHNKSRDIYLHIIQKDIVAKALIETVFALYGDVELANREIRRMSTAWANHLSGGFKNRKQLARRLEELQSEMRALERSA